MNAAAGSSTKLAQSAKEEADELRNQLQRLERLIHAIQTAPEPLRRKIAAAARNFAPKKQPEVIDIETADLVGALTRLCFSTATYQHDVPLPNGQSEIVADAKASLAAQEAQPGSAVPPKPTISARTVPELVSLLPSWEEVEPLLELYATRWWGCNDLLFPPAWARKVASMYQSGFSPLPHPHFLAEIFGVIALSVRGRASEQGSTSAINPEADRLAACCQRALDIGAYLDKPSLEGIRSLSLMVSYHAFWGTALARGLTVLPVALSLVMQLDFHRPDTDFDGAETPLESFERRALVSILVRSDWSYPHTLGRASIADPKVFLATPPQYLEADRYAADALTSPFRPIKPVVQALTARHHLARLHQKMTTELYQTNKMKIASAAVARYARDIETIEATHLSPELQWQEEGGHRSWKVHDVDIRTAIARLQANADFALCRVRLHKPFIGGRPAMVQIPPNFDEDYHRNELIHWARIYLWLWQQADQLTGFSFVSTFAFQAFDPIIALALIVLLHPGLPDREACKQAVLWFPAQADRPDSAPAVRRLGRLVRFLLERAETATNPAFEPARKRSKTSHNNNNNNVVNKMLSPPAAENARRASAPAIVPVPPMPRPESAAGSGVPSMPALSKTDFFVPNGAVTTAPASMIWPGLAPANPTPNGGGFDFGGYMGGSMGGSMDFNVGPLASMSNGDALATVNGHASDMLGDLGVDLGSGADPLAFLRGIDHGWNAADQPPAASSASRPALPSDLVLDEALLKALVGGT